MKYFNKLVLSFSIAMLISCGSADSFTDSEVDVIKNGSLAATFQPAEFSSYIELSEDQKWVRFKFAFFPDGTNFDFTNKRVIIPCDFSQSLPEGVDINLTAPLTPLCSQPYVISVINEGESLSVDGLVLSLERKAFADDFSIEITPLGVKNLISDTIITASKGKLVEYYTLILASRQVSLRE